MIKTIETFGCSRCPRTGCQREIDPDEFDKDALDLEIVIFGEPETRKLHHICNTCQPIVDNAIARILAPQKRKGGGE